MGRLKVVDAQGQPQWLVVLGEFDAIFGEKTAWPLVPLPDLPSFPLVLVRRGGEISPKPSASGWAFAPSKTGK